MYQQLDGNIDYWTDKAIEEVMRFGKNIKIVLIDAPLKIDYCPNDGKSLTRVLDQPGARKIVANDWRKKSIASVYINPTQSSLAIVIFYNEEEIMKMGIHRCGNKIKYMDYKGTKSAKVRKFCVRKQVQTYVKQILKKWEVGHVFYGTGNVDAPTLLEHCELPLCWEKNIKCR